MGDSIDLSSFSAGSTAVVVGASGGIGQAVCNALAGSGQFRRIVALSRSGDAPDGENIVGGTIDITDEDSVAASIAMIDGDFDLVFVATGILHRQDDDKPAIKPEKTWAAFDADAAAEVFAANTIGPMLVAKHCLPRLPKGRRGVFAAISARVGSISDNHLGGWYSYRASKAALNQLIRASSVELKRKNANAICVALHPGTVDTPLSEPFQKGVPNGKLFTADHSARAMLRVIANLKPEDSGRLFAWDGSEIAP